VCKNFSGTEVAQSSVHKAIRALWARATSRRILHYIQVCCTRLLHYLQPGALDLGAKVTSE
jgi:hypothetical protein